MTAKETEVAYCGYMAIRKMREVGHSEGGAFTLESVTPPVKPIDPAEAYYLPLPAFIGGQTGKPRASMKSRFIKACAALRKKR